MNSTEPVSVMSNRSRFPTPLAAVLASGLVAGCSALDLNRTAGDDNPLILLRLAVKPLAQAPFPIERIAQL